MNFGETIFDNDFDASCYSIILNGSQLDVGSLIPTERNEKDLRGIEKKMMRAKSTLD